MDYRIGDCREVLRTLPDEAFDCIVTDPPYGETNLGWDKRCAGWAAEARRVLKPTGSMWVFGSLRSLMAAGPELAGWRMAHSELFQGESFFDGDLGPKRALGSAIQP